MRVSFISPTVNMGGGTRVIVIYAQHLMRMGHTVRIISPPPKRIALRHRFKSLLKGDGWPTLRAHSHVDGSGLDHEVLDVWRPVGDRDVPEGDVVIATWWETAEWVNALDDSRGAKIYFIQHHEVFPHLPKRSRETYALPLHKIVVAQWLKKVMQSEYHDDNVDLVPNSVDRVQFFAPPRAKQRVPTVGLLYSTIPFKGVDTSLAALKSVRENIPNLRLVAFGSEKPRYDLRLPSGSDFYFSPAQDEIRNLYSQCDVWLTSSRSEGFNLPAMEAMACRTPVVATRTGWPEEAVKCGWNGVLADIDDTVALAKGVEWILSQSDEDWRRLSANAFSTVANCSWESSAELFEKALHHACRRAARGEIGGACKNDFHRD